jgi:hypothetical protein
MAFHPFEPEQLAGAIRDFELSPRSAEDYQKLLFTAGRALRSVGLGDGEFSDAIETGVALAALARPPAPPTMSEATRKAAEEVLEMTFGMAKDLKLGWNSITTPDCVVALAHAVSFEGVKDAKG